MIYQLLVNLLVMSMFIFGLTSSTPCAATTITSCENNQITVSCLLDGDSMDILSDFVISSEIPGAATVTDIKMDFRGFVVIDPSIQKLSNTYINLDGYLKHNGMMIQLFGNGKVNTPQNCPEYIDTIYLSLKDDHEDKAMTDAVCGDEISFSERRPVELFSNFNGLNPNGKWEIEVINYQPDLYGFFTSIDMVIHVSECPAV